MGGFFQDLIFGKDQEASRVEPGPASAEETALLEMLMNMYQNPQASPQVAMDTYLGTLGVANDFYSKYPEYAASNLNKQVDTYRKDLQAISNSPGVALSFGGNPVTTTNGTQAQIKPLRTMAMQKSLADSGFNAGYGMTSDVLAALNQAISGRLGVTNEQVNATMTPAQKMWQTMLAGRYGTPVSVEPATQGLIGTFMESLAKNAGKTATGGGFSLPTPGIG